MKQRGIYLMLVCTIFTAMGQFFLKKGAANLTIPELFFNYSLIFGFFLYGIGALLMIFALKFGELNTLYPIVSLTFIWVTLLSIFVLKEPVSGYQYLGIGTILAGVFIIAKGGKA
jgi:drug/metabolite transporter (DMT)-like permease